MGRSSLMGAMNEGFTQRDTDFEIDKKKKQVSSVLMKDVFYCSVKGFTDEIDTIIMPQWMYNSVGLKGTNGLVVVEYVHIQHDEAEMKELAK